jgi:hypothetical protein
MAAALFGLVGCGSTTSGGATGEEETPAAEPAPRGRSGTRLTALAYQAGEALQFRRFYDKELGFDCQFGLDGTGTPRCFPERSAEVLYLDASCKSPAVRQDGLTRGEWLSDESYSCPGELATHRGAYVVGEQLHGESIVGQEEYQLYRITDGGCEAAPAAAKLNPPVHRLVRTPFALAAGRVETFETATGLRIDRIVGEDGAAANLGVELADGTACALQRNGTCTSSGTTSWQQVECSPVEHRVGQSDAQLLDLGEPGLHLETFELHDATSSHVFRIPADGDGRFLTKRGSCWPQEASGGNLVCFDQDDEVDEASYWTDPACEHRLYAPRNHDMTADSPLIPELRYVEHGEGYRITDARAVKLYQGPLYSVEFTACRAATAEELSQLKAPLFAFDDDRYIGVDRLPQVQEVPLP